MNACLGIACLKECLHVPAAVTSSMTINISIFCRLRELSGGQLKLKATHNTSTKHLIVICCLMWQWCLASSAVCYKQLMTAPVLRTTTLSVNFISMTTFPKQTHDFEGTLSVRLVTNLGVYWSACLFSDIKNWQQYNEGKHHTTRFIFIHYLDTTMFTTNMSLASWIILVTNMFLASWIILVTACVQQKWLS